MKQKTLEDSIRKIICSACHRSKEDCLDCYFGVNGKCVDKIITEIKELFVEEFGKERLKNTNHHIEEYTTGFNRAIIKAQQKIRGMK